MVVIGSWLGLVTSLLVLLTAVVTLINGRKTNQNGVKIEEVHGLVNGLHDRDVNRVSQLTGTITDAGLDVPASPHQPEEK